MITKVTHIPIFVHNQDEALKFYTEKLGLVPHTDTTFDGFRWLTICPPNQPDFELALMPARSEQEKALIGTQAATTPLICLETENCLKTYQELKERGIEFLDEPNEQPWGTCVSFKDLYGNVLYLVQPPQQ